MWVKSHEMEKRMKKALIRISLLLALILVFVMCFAACGETETPPSDGSSESSQGGATGSSDNGGATNSSKPDKPSTDNSSGTGSSGTDNSGTDNSGTDNSGTDNSGTDNSSNTGDDGTDNPGGNEGQTYTVTFDTSRESNPASIPAQEVAENGKVTEPDYTPYKKGSEFLGWFVDGNQNNPAWDFDNDVVTGNIKLVAVFSRPGQSGGTEDNCEHDLEITENVAPTCEIAGRRVEKCTICKKIFRYNKDNDPTLAKLEHLELEEVVDSTCALDGYRTVYCPNGCGLTLTTKIPATGEHVYDVLGWTAVVKPTLYVDGRLENACTGCGGAIQTRVAKYTASEDDLYAENVDISFLYTGGSYVNEPFVNVAGLGKVLVSSYFDGTKGPYANDGNTTTFWNADTYVDGAKYTDDWLLLELSDAFEVGAVKFVLPNYSAWELGEGCHVSYDLEYWDTENEEWVFICEVSDKEALAVGMNCEFMKVLDAPVKTNQIRARVTHATRYAPAVVYEIEAYAKTEETERVPSAFVNSAAVSVSGKYNEWATGADALKDNTTATHWYTDARYNAQPWALYEYAQETYFACVQFSVSSIKGRTLKLELYQNGEWKTFGSYMVPKAGETNEYAISNTGGICVFNVNIEDFASKMKFTITAEPEYWTSYVYDITPYTITEQPYGEMPAFGCSHANPSRGEVIPASCGVPGYTVMNCVCGAKIKTRATDALTHDWGKYSVETAATVDTLGTKVSTCRREGCGATSTITYEEKYEMAVVTPYLHNAPAAWAQTFDDGNYLSTYVWANEHLARYGAHATVMMSITYSDSLVSTWTEHFKKGVFDLGSHSYNHTSIYAGQAGVSGLLSEVVNAQYWFRHSFRGQSVLTFAAPLGTTSQSVAEYLMGPMAANRNGGDTGIFYNTIDQLISREIWGDLNSYISKADQTEGDYIFLGKDGSVYVKQFKENREVFDENGDFVYALAESYENADSNYIFDWDSMTFVDKGKNHPGTYYYDKETYVYSYRETGSYNLVDGKFVFVNDDSGEFKLHKATIGSYEKGVEELVSVGGFTVECLHETGSSAPTIFSTYASTISKLEHLTRFGVWAPSYNELTKYLREYQNAKVQIIETTGTSITLSVADGLDDYMFNQALTIKVDIPDSWTSVSVAQGGKNIPFVALSEYKQTKNMNDISCTIEDGFLYVDVIPDAGDVVITMGEKGDGADYEEKVNVSFEPGEGTLHWSEYETRVVIGGTVSAYPTPERYGFKFLGWYYDEACTEIVFSNDTFNEDATLYAGWEKLPVCTDGSLNHKWGNWTVATDNEHEIRVCSKCKAEEQRKIEKAD